MGDQFTAFLMGTHSRLGAFSMVSRLDDVVLRRVHEFVKREPIWSDLEAKVEEAGLHVCTADFDFTPKHLVEQYRAFLDLKVEHEDWASVLLSPPMIEFKGRRILDEVWHLHIAMSCYEEDCMLLSNGHVITHQPILGDAAKARYRFTYDLHIEWCDQRGLKVDERCWPDPYELDRIDRSNVWDRGGCG